MFNELEFQKLKKEYPDFFEKISSGLLSFILSEETSSLIAQICLENKIGDEEKIEKIAYQVTLALLEQTPKENLSEIFEKGMGLDSETAKKIHIEVNQLIFSQVQKTQPKEKKITQPKKISFSTTKEEESEKPIKKDNYRETIK